MKLRILCSSDEATGETATTRLPMLLPHEMFGALFKAGVARWERTMGDKASLQEFWGHALQFFSWTRDHPQTDAFQSGMCIPLALYGDSAKVTKEDSLLTFTWNSIVCSHVRPSVESKLVICAVPTTWLADLDEISAVIIWSMGAICDGKYPTHDHVGGEFPKNSWRKLVAGLPLANGYSGALVEFRGDWEWMAKSLGAPSATSNECCWRCLAQRQGEFTWTDFRATARWRATSRFRMPRETPLSLLPFHVDMVRPDVMHTVCLGVGLWVNATLLLVLAEKGLWGPGPLAVQLRNAWVKFKEWLHLSGLGHCSQRCFTPRRVQMTGERADYAELVAKAWNSRLVSSFLALEVQQVPLESEEDHLHATLAWALAESYHLCEGHGRYLSESVASKYLETVSLAANCYRELSARYLQQGVLRLPMRPKLHLWMELSILVAQDRYNPRHYHCFGDEDFLRTVLRAARACARAVMPAAVVRRFSLRLALLWAGRARPRPPRVLPPTKKRPFKLRNRL